MEKKIKTIAGIVGIVIAISGVTSIYSGHGFWGTIFVLFGLLVAVFPSCIWFVQTGEVGFVSYFKKMQNKSYSPGMNFRIPGISDVSVLNVQVQSKSLADTKKTLSRNSVFLKYTLTYQLNERYAHLVMRLLGADYFATHVEKWIDAVTDTLISQLSYPHFQAKKAEVENWISKLVQSELIKKSSEITKDIVSGDFDATCCEFEVVKDLAGNPQYETVSMGDGRTENIQMFDLIEAILTLEGVNLFKNVSVKLNEVKFEEGYEKAQAQIKINESQLEAQKIENERQKSVADTKRYYEEQKAVAQRKTFEELVAACGGDVEKATRIVQAQELAKSKVQVVGGGASPFINIGGSTNP